MKTKFTRIYLSCILLIFLSLNAIAVSITSFKPKVGVPGTLITITGKGLDSLTKFTIGGVPAIIVSNTGTQLVGMVMPGARSGNITVATAQGTAVSQTNFMLVVTPVPGGVQGAKLVGNDNAGLAAQGVSVASSADTHTVIVGGNKDNNGIGAAWIYIFGGKQQGKKLVGKGFAGVSAQGTSVSISADGNTAIIGAPGDNNNQGAVWVFIRTDTIWKQQGSKLVVTGITGPAQLGTSVSLSANGQTLVAEAAGSNNNAGAAYIFTRKDTVWTQQGPALTATGSAAGSTNGDQRVAISADGNTFIMGAHTATANAGGAWIFTRSNNTWAQQGSTLIGTGNITAANQGSSVAINADGNIAAIGGPADDNNQGAAWIFARKAGVWKQQGVKLIAKAATGAAQQGSAVSLNADGTLLILAGKDNDSSTGAAWLFNRKDTVWSQASLKIIGAGAVGGSNVGNSVALGADGIFSVLGGVNDNSGQGAAWVAGNFSGFGYGSSTCAQPVVTTIPATLVTTKTANLNGSVDASALVFYSSVVFEIATLPDMSNSIVLTPTSGTTPLLSFSAFTTQAAGLLPSTTYYFRIVAADYCSDITYGNTLSFTTDPDAPGSGLSPMTIPSAFSPNHDGINDTWEMPFLGSYANASVKVFNRYGQTVFSSVGYATAWDGKYKDADLPAGAYYYVIDLKNQTAAISGSVNLVK